MFVEIGVIGEPSTGKAFPRNSNAREDFFPDHRLVPFFQVFPASSVFCIAYGICDSKMAALSSVGVLNFGDKTSSNSDSWQDANTALQELDKGR